MFLEHKSIHISELRNCIYLAIGVFRLIFNVFFFNLFFLEPINFEAEIRIDSHIYSRRLVLPNLCSQSEDQGPRCEIKISQLSYFLLSTLSEEEEEEEDGDCVKERTQQAGLTVWRKVGVELESLSLDRHDFTFSRQVRGEAVPLATGGDCYSTAGCPRGGFRLDLAGTGLVVARQTDWREEGSFTHSNITRHQVSTDLQYMSCRLNHSE